MHNIGINIITYYIIINYKHLIINFFFIFKYPKFSFITSFSHVKESPELAPPLL